MMHKKAFMTMFIHIYATSILSLLDIFGKPMIKQAFLDTRYFTDYAFDFYNNFSL